MALTDEIVYQSELDCWPVLEGIAPLRASRYAEITEACPGRCVKIRGSAFDEYTGNYFRPEEARRIARHILELADEAERDPSLDELKSDLAAAHKAVYGLVLFTETDAKTAEVLHQMGYRKTDG